MLIATEAVIVIMNIDATRRIYEIVTNNSRTMPALGLTWPTMITITVIISPTFIVKGRFETNPINVMLTSLIIKYHENYFLYLYSL